MHIYVRIEPRWGFADVHTGIDNAVYALEPVVEWADRDAVRRS